VSSWFSRGTALYLTTSNAAAACKRPNEMGHNQKIQFVGAGQTLSNCIQAAFRTRPMYNPLRHKRLP
jgi:hypothetical protein